MEQLGLNLGYLLVQIFCFLIILVVVNAWIVKPLRGMLEKRREKITQGMEDARVAAEARANAEKDASAIIADANIKASHIISEATDKADAVMVDIKVEADKEITKEREATLIEVEEERNRMLGDLRGQVASLAIAAAQRIIGEALDEKKQHALLNEFFSGIKSGKVSILEKEDVSGNEAEITSALPLSVDEQGIVKKNVLRKLGERAKVEFKVDPGILGGLIVQVGDKIVDGSVAAQLEDLRKSLK